MKHSDKPVIDNENDSLLFERLEQNAVQHYPNPKRRGCPSSDVLKKFVESPTQVSVNDLNELHIFHCAECTLELKKLRENREQSISHERRTGGVRVTKWWMGIAALLVFGIALSITRVVLDRKAAVPTEYTANLVLRDESVERGAETGIVIPRGEIALNIELNPSAAAGSYEVVLSRQRSLDKPMLRVTIIPVTTASGTRLTAYFDLRKLQPGGYWIGVRGNAGAQVWFTFVSIE